jgi:protein-tyrosine phosphatase
MCGPFDAVVLAARELQARPRGRCLVIHAPLRDSTPSREEIYTALLTARKVKNLRKKGANVLVTCAQGINRSALIAALALMMDGASAGEAVKHIRKKRKGTHMKPLSNRAFVRVLKKYEEVRR